MTEISENPVLNPQAAAALRFQEITPEIQNPAELPPESPPGSAEAVDDKPAARTRSRSSTTRTPGRHRKAITSGTTIKDEEKDEDKKPDPPKIKPPDFREWHDFGANFVFKWLCRGYVAYVFKGIDRERVLNAAELKALEPDPEMLSSATKPLAHAADRSKFMSKHGRAIIDSADGIEAMIAIGMYANTVRRIAKSHEQERQPSNRKPRKVDARIVSEEPVRRQHSGPDVEEEQKPRIRVVNGESGFQQQGFGVGG